MGTLHVVSTPIGNLEDITLRALRVLKEVDVILAEDTRRTRVLLNRFEIPGRPRSLHAHNEASRIAEVGKILAEGGSVALVSDAGTPLVSDPGARLVAACVSEGHSIVAVPGPSALLAALCISGLPTESFVFLGFLPRRAGARRSLLMEYRNRSETLVIFESPRRLARTLEELGNALGDRAACVARELTKIHEEAVRAPLSGLAERFAAGARGEVTIVVDGAPADTTPAEAPEDLDTRIRALLDDGRRPREIASRLAAESSLPRRALYARAVELQQAATEP